MSKPERVLKATPRFLKSKRGLDEDVQLVLDDQVRTIGQNPLIGESKTGALKGVRVVKFKVGPRQYLLAYTFAPKPNVIDFIDVGVHENFDRDVQNYMRDR